MAIRCECWSCGTPLRVGDALAGKKARCPHCGAEFMCPSTSEEVRIPREVLGPPLRRWPAPGRAAAAPRSKRILVGAIISAGLALVGFIIFIVAHQMSGKESATTPEERASAAAGQPPGQPPPLTPANTCRVTIACAPYAVPVAIIPGPPTGVGDPSAWLQSELRMERPGSGSPTEKAEHTIDELLARIPAGDWKQTPTTVPLQPGLHVVVANRAARPEGLVRPAGGVQMWVMSPEKNPRPDAVKGGVLGGSGGVLKIARVYQIVQVQEGQKNLSVTVDVSDALFRGPKIDIPKIDVPRIHLPERR